MDQCSGVLSRDAEGMKLLGRRRDEGICVISKADESKVLAVCRVGGTTLQNPRNDGPLRRLRRVRRDQRHRLGAQTIGAGGRTSGLGRAERISAANLSRHVPAFANYGQAAHML